MKKYNYILYLLALVKLVLPFFLQNSVYEPHRDEMLYLAEGSHMAWGFMEVPPLLSVFAWLIHLCGDGLFWVKFWPSLLGALTYIVTGRIILSLGGQAFALLLGFLPFIFGGFLRVHFLFQPNALEYLGWTCIVYTLIRFVQTEKVYWLYLMGVCCGLGMLSKYSVAFLIVSLLVGLLVTPQRKIFTRKHIYFAALIAFIIFLPNLVWQFNHGFPVFYHMEVLQRSQLRHITAGSFLFDQLLLHFPCVFIWITGLVATLFVKRFAPYRFVGIAYLSVIGLFLLGHGKAYYAMGVYPVLFAFGACELEQVTIFRFTLTKILIVAIPVFLGYAAIPILLPVKEPQALVDYYIHEKYPEKLGVLKWEDGKSHPLPQDFADMLGWEEMARKAGKAYHKLDAAEKAKTLVFCDNYGQAGALNYYRKKYGLPVAYSDNASFLYWMPESDPYENLLLVTDDPNEMQYDFVKDFKSVTLEDSVTSTYARERGSLIIMMKGMNEKMRNMFKEKIAKKKARTAPGM